MGSSDSDKSLSLEENLKKALTEVLVLHLLSVKDCYIGELTDTIREKSGGALTIVFPYGAIYRLEQAGYLAACGKRTAPAGRRRQYYRITDAGRVYLGHLKDVYARFSAGVAEILAEGGDFHVQ